MHTGPFTFGQISKVLQQQRQGLPALGEVAVFRLVPGIAVWVMIWASFGFRFEGARPDAREGQVFHKAWDKVSRTDSVVFKCLDSARTHCLLPEAYIYGFTYVHFYAQNRVAYLRGKVSPDGKGWWYFFPYSFLVKTPMSFLALMVLGLLGWLLRHQKDLGEAFRSSLYRWAPLWVLMLVYGLFSLGTNLNVGHRHILVLYPCLFLLAGSTHVLFQSGRRGVQIIAACCLLGFAVESVQASPHYLAYFNAAAGGSAKGHTHLIDSSLDWGQDLPGLKTWLVEEKVDPNNTYLAYFGTASPRHYGIRARWLPGGPDLYRKKDFSPFQEGTYCISATLFHGVGTKLYGPWTRQREQMYQNLLKQVQYYSSKPNQDFSAEERRRALETAQHYMNFRFSRLCSFLQDREPDAQAGHSILIFKISKDEIQRYVYGPPEDKMFD